MASAGADEDDWIPEGMENCRNGAKCYRKNAEHFATYAHPRKLLERQGLVSRSCVDSLSFAGAAPIDQPSAMSYGDDIMSMSFGEVRTSSLSTWSSSNHRDRPGSTLSGILTRRLCLPPSVFCGGASHTAAVFFHHGVLCFAASALCSTLV